MPHKTVILDRCDSTNDEARDPRYRHGDIVAAEAQRAGRGQQGNTWVSEPGKNLTFSLVLEPEFLPAGEQFQLLRAVSLGVADALDAHFAAACDGGGPIPHTQIKWPNDIFVGGKKIAGLLIENDILGASLARSIVGIGLNVNQVNFQDNIPAPTSVVLETGIASDRAVLLEALRGKILARYAQLETSPVERLEKDYLDRLYLKGVRALFRRPGGEPFAGVIREAAPSGELVVEHCATGRRHAYLFKEIELIRADDGR